MTDKKTAAQPVTAAAFDLSAMPLPELKALKKQVDAAVDGFEAKKKAEALAAVAAKAKEMGFDLKQLTGTTGGKPGKATRAPAVQKFANPADANQTWSGRGVKPGWFKALIAAGKEPTYLT